MDSLSLKNPAEISVGAPRLMLRAPVAEDGVAINDLIARCAPLDRNSVYCNLLQCTHFASSCVVAEHAGRPVGWVSGYRIPDEPDALFVWQVAVDAEARGQRLGGRMIKDILSRKANSGVLFVKTTITQDNEASWRLFRALADELNAPFEAAPLFFRNTHFAGAHATEVLVTIGPFADGL